MVQEAANSVQIILKTMALKFYKKNELNLNQTMIKSVIAICLRE